MKRLNKSVTNPLQIRYKSVRKIAFLTKRFVTLSIFTDLRIHFKSERVFLNWKTIMLN